MIDLKQCSLGIELGSTRIKAVLVGDTCKPVAQGDFTWENRLENGIWTYPLEEVWQGVQAAYAALAADVLAKCGQPLTTVGCIGVSAMMHGYLAFDAAGKLLVPFRTWRNTMTGAAAEELTSAFGFNILSNAGVFEGLNGLGFAPCTPAACMEILDYYGIDCKGKNAVVIGRSLVVGKPAAMMLMGKNATVTVCHTKTVNTAEICRNADIIVSAAGVLNSLTKDYVRPGQVVVDVSINWDENKINAKGGKGGIAGDAKFDEVEPIVEAITPVPGGVGSVTTSVLMKHVVEAAERV